ncbi:DUF3307 domain-containing protein [Histidinibacterium aquaticum]|uniref:DUF3307 domain-containing protein n=1 Tax=Histidinibacterium aquaticum TaxID=2613962 RepID=A0A5J5GL57_9RHOB|nr:DUF3307 domain-containing protein [Histidinibacterium aquaticum]KAA9008945.1 DUF3307 domain-containing protein [Histidinibacterium aquaticum]
MAETFTALLIAHVLADFVFQTDGMIRRKARIPVLLLHALVVLALLLAAFGRLDVPALYLLALAHLVIDAVKVRFGDSLRPFLLDQGAHLATLGIATLAVPDLWAQSLWMAVDPGTARTVLAVLLYVAGFTVAVRAGGFAVGKLLAPMTPHWVRARILSGGFPGAGRIIGQLERGLTFALVLIGQPTGVAFLVAAKSVMRFNATREDRSMAEYVIIGTLASVAWALAAAYGTQWLAQAIGIAPP